MQTAIPSVCLELFQALLEGYLQLHANEEQLEQAKSWYAQMMDLQKGQSLRIRLMRAQMLSQIPYFQREERRALLPSISLKRCWLTVTR